MHIIVYLRFFNKGIIYTILCIIYEIIEGMHTQLIGFVPKPLTSVRVNKNCILKTYLYNSQENILNI